MRKNTVVLLVFSVLILAIGIPVVSAYSGNAVSLYNTGTALTNSGNYTEAIAAFDQAIALEPGYFEAWNGKADALNRDERFTDALTASDRALAINPAYVKGWINRGYILYNLGRYDDELKAYEKAIALDPTSAEAWFNKGYALGGMGKWDEALKNFDKVESLDPAYPNLAANQKIAHDNLDAITPIYVKQAPVIAVVAIIVIGIVLWIWAVRKKN